MKQDMTDVQRNLNQKSYNDGHTWGMFWGCIFGFVTGIFVTVLIFSFVI